MTDRCPLMPRQLECITLASYGYTMENMAHKIGISVHTVRTYLRNARDIVGVGSETALVAMALRRGWIS